MQPLLSDSVSRAIKNIQRVADLMLSTAASPRGARYSLTELFLFEFSDLLYRPKSINSAGAPEIAETAGAALGAASAAASGAAAESARLLAHVKLAHTVLKTYEATLQTLLQCNFVPGTRASDFAAALTSETAITAHRLEVLCDVSNDTATRWLNKAVTANLLRRIKFGKKFVYINLHHFALIQDLPIPLSAIPSATGLRTPKSDHIMFANPAKYLDLYPPRYLESITPPF